MRGLKRITFLVGFKESQTAHEISERSVIYFVRSPSWRTPVWNRHHDESLFMTNPSMKSSSFKPATPHVAPSPANNPGQPAAPVAAPEAKPAEAKK